MTTTSAGSSLLPTRLLILTLAAAVSAGGCGTSASDATDISLTAEKGVAGGLGTRRAYRDATIPSGTTLPLSLTSSMASAAPATKGEDATKIGIGAGTGVVLATKGKEVRLGPGATVTSRLTAPLTVRMHAASVLK